ncbi:hypothetical protein KIN20_018282 [Parelaphostrongylus tenuis]|uniref:Uncharacterized protein n=1 Tax=Parelaphostrongylus tenuis TaxID=148309 RepID=A0AAD5MJP1_PARTN|nr:hypothetical protein KIN20_018282 [Parelaphostrongylus tenuis]
MTDYDYTTRATTCVSILLRSHRFGSKFLLHGYVGSEGLLSHNHSTGHTPSPAPQSTRSRRLSRPSDIPLIEDSTKHNEKPRNSIRASQYKAQ